MLMIQVWKLARRSKLASALKILRDILGQVLGLVVLADELVGHVEDLSPVLADDQVPRYLISGQTLLDQAVGRQRLRGGRVNGHAFSASGRWGGTPES